LAPLAVALGFYSVSITVGFVLLGFIFTAIGKLQERAEENREKLREQHQSISTASIRDVWNSFQQGFSLERWDREIESLELWMRLSAGGCFLFGIVGLLIFLMQTEFVETLTPGSLFKLVIEGLPFLALTSIASGVLVSFRLVIFRRRFLRTARVLPQHLQDEDK